MKNIKKIAIHWIKLLILSKKKVPKKFKYNHDLEIENNLTPLAWKKKIL